jgi:deoxyribonuclease-4
VRAKALGCNTIQIFSHNPRRWDVKDIPGAEIEEFKSLREQYGISPVYIHTSYLINIATKDRDLREKSREMLILEMERAEAIGADFVILHPGSASGDDKTASKKRVIRVLNKIAETGTWKPGLLLENTAGERGDIASAITGLSEIMNSIKGEFISGVCIDTCHAFTAGYDIRVDRGMKRITQEIREYIGIDKVKVIHLNDSKRDAGSHVDRHDHIGKGKIGVKGLSTFVHSDVFSGIPLILETPKKRESDDLMNLIAVRQIMRKERYFIH